MLALWHVLVARSASAAANPSNWHQRSAFPGHVSAAGTIAPDDPKGCARNPSTNSNNASGSNGDDKSNSPAGTGTNPGSTVPRWRRLVPIGQSAAGMDPFPLGKHNHYLSLHRFSPRSYHFLTQICQTPFHSSTVKTLSLPARPFFAGIHWCFTVFNFPRKIVHLHSVSFSLGLGPRFARLPNTCDGFNGSGRTGSSQSPGPGKTKSQENRKRKSHDSREQAMIPVLWLAYDDDDGEIGRRRR